MEFHVRGDHLFTRYSTNAKIYPFFSFLFLFLFFVLEKDTTALQRATRNNDLKVSQRMREGDKNTLD